MCTCIIFQRKCTGSRVGSAGGDPQAVRLAQQQLEATKSQYYPTLGVNASYGWQRSNNGPVSFAPQTQSIGLSVTGSVNFNIFDGFRVRQQVQAAERSDPDAQEILAERYGVTPRAVRLRCGGRLVEAWR